MREGLISPENAEILLRRNQTAAGAAADAVKRKLLTVLAILCATLLGGGLIFRRLSNGKRNKSLFDGLCHTS